MSECGSVSESGSANVQCQRSNIYTSECPMSSYTNVLMCTWERLNA